MTPFLKLLAGLAAIAALGIFSIEIDLLPGSRADAEARLRERAEAALTAAGAGWAEADMQGQKAVLSGVAPDEAAARKAAEALERSTWSGGVLVGGVTSVDASAVAVQSEPPVVAPFVWVAERLGEEIVFSGYAPSAEAREAVYRIARAHFPGAEISGELDIAQGAPPEHAWLAAAETSLQALSRLEEGAAAATGSRFEVSGRAADHERAQAARALMNSLPPGIAGAADVTAPAPQPPPDETPAAETAADEAPSDEEGAAAEPTVAKTASADQDAPADDDAAEDMAGEADAEEPVSPGAEAETVDDAGEAAAAETAQEPADEPVPPAEGQAEPVEQAAAAEAAPPQETADGLVRLAETQAEPAQEAEPVDPAVLAECRTRLERMLVGLQVSFDSEGTAIDSASQEQLLELATILMICPYFDVRITGHTDASGSEAQNLRLSRERAESVAAFLRSFGVDDEMLSARGAGSSVPLADNSTPEGRALNRRIEFTLALDALE